jgi:hypothetical protein
MCFMAGRAGEARIEVWRVPDHTPDRFRAYAVRVDGVPAGRIRPDETAVAAVGPGWHIVRVRIGWCGSDPCAVDLGPGESVRLACRPAMKSGLLWPLYVTLRRNRYLRLERIPEFEPTS